MTTTITAYQGERIVPRVEVNDQAGADKSLAGATILFRLGHIRNTETVFEKTGELVSGGTTGIIQVTITPEESLDIDAGEYDFQFVCTDNTGAVQVVLDGRMVIKYLLRAPT